MRPIFATTRAVWSAPLPEMPRRTTRLAARVIVWLISPWARLESRQRLAQLPEPVIFAFNHNNSLESILVPALLIFHRRGRIVRFLVDWMYIYLPVIGWFIRQIEPIPVYTKPDRYRLFEKFRQDRRQRFSPVAASLDCLAAGASLGIFPEGTRNRSADQLRRARGGLAQIVLASSVPVVPVGIHYPAKDRLGRIPRFGHFVVKIGEPMDFTAERATGDARAVTDRVMEEISTLCEKTYAYSRPSVDSEPDPEPVRRTS